MTERDEVERRWVISSAKIMDRFHPGPAQDVPIVSGSKVGPDERVEVMSVSDHLERVEELERDRDEQLAEARDAHEATGALVRRNVERYEKHKARADALQALLSEAVEEFERQAKDHGSETEVGAGIAVGFLTAANHLKQRLDELGTEDEPVRGGADG